MGHHRTQTRPYHHEYKGNSYDWERRKVFMKHDPDIVFASKPRDVDNLLECRMSVWVMLGPVRFMFLRDAQ
jgi:hypothetical protein